MSHSPSGSGPEFDDVNKEKSSVESRQPDQDSAARTDDMPEGQSPGGNQAVEGGGVGTVPGQPAKNDSLPRLPRKTVAERLNERRSTGLIYRIFNRFERQGFAKKFGRQIAPSDVIVARRGFRLWLMRVDPRITGRSASHHNLDLVVSICEQKAIQYFAVPEPSTVIPRIAILDADWQSFLDGLKQVAATAPLYVSVDARDSRGRTRKWSSPLADSGCADAATIQRRIEIFEILTQDAQSREFFGRRQSCLVERWTEDDRGALTSPTINERTRHIGASHRTAATIQVNDRELTSLEPLTTPHIFEPAFDVDLVYLWVDSSDKKWQERKRNAFAAVTNQVQPEAAGDERFRDYGELRFSLRSVHEYVPWARHVYLVTDQQIPDWLNTEHPKLQVIDHTELFGDDGRLPTFNSHAIGSRLHHIPGLSENYLYLNDDVMFGRPVGKNQFFYSNGLSKFFLSKATLPYTDAGFASPHEEARRNVVNLLEKEFGQTATQTFFHTAIPQRRMIMEELEGRYPDIFQTNLNSQFRSPDDFEINSWLHNYYGYLQGMAMPASIRYDYFDLSDAGIAARMSKLLVSRDKDCFCVNDSANALPENQDFVSEWLQYYFPRPSPFEITAR